MSTNLPRFTVIAHTDLGDHPRYTDDPTFVPVLVGNAVRSRHAGAVTVEEHGSKIDTVQTWDDEGVADLLAQVAGTEEAA